MRALFLVGALGLMALGQVPNHPTRILDTEAVDLGWRFGLFVTPEGRILAYAEAGEVDGSPQLGIWDGPSGVPGRLDLRPWKPTESPQGAWVGCGGIGGAIPPIIEPNDRNPGWDPASRAFDLLRLPEAPRGRLSEQGDVLEGGDPLPAPARVEVLGFTDLQVTRADGSRETFSRPMADIPDRAGMTGLQKSLSRWVGYQQVLASREGDWVAATWIDGSRNLPNRVAPWIPKGPLRWLLFRAGDPRPVVDLPLFALIGAAPDRVSMELSPEGTRLILSASGRVLVLDPQDGTVLLNRAGALVHLTSQSDELVMAHPGEGWDLARFDLREGRRTGTLHLPPSLDPPAEGEGPEAPAPRALTPPLAFSPDGHWAVTARERRQGPGWDALVLWAFQAP